MKINCIAVDDEPLALDIIRAYCSKVPFLNLTGTFSNAFDALEYLRLHTVDLMFLDIQMEQLTGIQLLNSLKNKPLVIFTTAYDQYAIQGFDLDVLDYLLKPIPFERFVKASNKALEHLQKNPDAIVPEKQEKPMAAGSIAFFFVKTETRIEKVNADEVLYVEGMGDYWRIVTKNRRIMTLMNARGIEEILHEPGFCRVHKSYFVAMNKIEFVERKQIKIGEALIPISDTYQKNFFELIEKHKMM
jgi:two-component system, LytTR family, response regulator